MSVVKALGNRVLVQPDATETETEGGIKLPAAAQKKAESGVVVHVGDGYKLKNGKLKSPKVFIGDHVLFTDSGYEPVISDDKPASFVDGEHIFARGVCSYPVFKYNGVHIGFDHEAIRDLIFILPALPPTMLGGRGIIHGTKKHQKKHHDKTGMILSAGPGHLNVKEGRFRPMDPRLAPGTIVQFDLSVPWGTTVRDTDGKKHYVCMCGNTDIFGILDYIKPAYIEGADGG